MLFFDKWLKNHPQFLLHFLIHIDVLMLCRKFEKICQNLKNTLYYYSPCFFPKMAQKSLQIFITFSQLQVDMLYELENDLKELSFYAVETNDTIEIHTI